MTMSIQGVGAASALPALAGPSHGPQKGAAGGSFMRVIEDLLQKANSQDAQAHQAVEDLATGKTDELHNVMLTVAKADLSFRLVLEMRNRLAEAYQEVMRMQV